MHRLAIAIYWRGLHGSISTLKCSSKDIVFILHNFWFLVMLGQHLRENLQSSWPFWTHLSQTSECSPKNNEVEKGEAPWVRPGFFSSWFCIFVPQIQIYSNWLSPFLNWPQPFSEEPIIMSGETWNIDTSCRKIRNGTEGISPSVSGNWVLFWSQKGQFPAAACC